MKRFIAIAALLLSTAPAQAVNYEKCEAMNKMYGRLDYQMSQAMKAVGGWVSESEDPEGNARWKAAATKAGMPYQNKINKLKTDYTNAGCLL